MSSACTRTGFYWLLAAVAIGTVVFLMNNVPTTRYFRWVSPVICAHTEDEKPTVYHSEKRACQFHLPFVIPGKVSSKICTYDPSIDTMISGYIKRTQSWEPDEISTVLSVMEKDVKENITGSGSTALSFVDIGCNIGVFTLSAAFNGYKVLAVDAMTDSLQLLATSLRLANLSSRVVLINNAISDRHETVVIRVEHSNVGASRVMQLKTHKNDTEKKILAVRAVCLDDLVPYVPTQRVFMKMDIEASEWLALRCSDKFFSEVDVGYFMIEWMAYVNSHVESGWAILMYLEERGYRPFHFKNTDELLKYEKLLTWPQNILFMRK